MNTLRKHHLLPANLAATLPALYSTDGQGENALVVAHFFSPYMGWDWYVLEYNPSDGLCFGWVNGWEGEYGYFLLSELEDIAISVNGHAVPAVERDLYWTPVRLGDVK